MFFLSDFWLLLPLPISELLLLRLLHPAVRSPNRPLLQASEYTRNRVHLELSCSKHPTVAIVALPSGRWQSRQDLGDSSSLRFLFENLLPFCEDFVKLSDAIALRKHFATLLAVLWKLVGQCSAQDAEQLGDGALSMSSDLGYLDKNSEGMIFRDYGAFFRSAQNRVELAGNPCRSQGRNRIEGDHGSPDNSIVLGTQALKKVLRKLRDHSWFSIANLVEYFDRIATLRLVASVKDLNQL